MASSSKAGDTSQEVDESPTNRNIQEAKANIIGFMSGDNDSEAVIRDFMASTLTLWSSNNNIEEDVPDDDGVEFSEDITESELLESAHSTDSADINKLEIYKEKLQKCVDDLLSSEENYVWNLKQLVLYVRDEDPLFSLIPQEVFSNTRDIYILHSNKLHPSLKKAYYDLEALGNVFLQNEKNMKMYTKQYSIKSEGCYDIVNQHKYTVKLLQNKIQSTGTLQNFFENPFARIDSYCLALDTIIKIYECMLASAPIKVIRTEQLTLVDTLKDANERLINLIHQIESKDSVACIKRSRIDLLAQGVLLREDFFIVVDEKKIHYKMKCFLFEKSLVFTVIDIKDTKQRLLFFDEIDTAQLGFTAPRGQADPSFTVWYQKFNLKQYTLISNDDVREQWVDNIKQILWQQMVDKKGEQLKKLSKLNRSGQ